MTGNLVYLAFSLGTLGTTGAGPILPYVSVLAFFVLGPWPADGCCGYPPG